MTDALPAGYGFRSPTPDDLHVVAGVLIADELDDTGRIVLGADFVRNQWNSSDFELATDAWVVLDEQHVIVAYGQAGREEPDLVESWGVVHPRHRGRGLGSWLLDRIEERAAQLLADRPAARFRHAVNAGDRAAETMVRDRGLRPVRHFWHMGIDLEGPVRPEPAPEGIAIRRMDGREDLVAIHAVLEEAFADDWGYHPGPFERWAAENASGPDHDPELWLLARDGAVPVDALTAHAGSERGWVGEIGVLISHRGRGIAAALLRRSFALFAERGIRHVLLNVDSENPTGATGLYERVGMRVVKRWDLWERPSNGFA